MVLTLGIEKKANRKGRKVECRSGREKATQIGIRKEERKNAEER